METSTCLPWRCHLSSGSVYHGMLPEEASTAETAVELRRRTTATVLPQLTANLPVGLDRRMAPGRTLLDVTAAMSTARR